MDNDEELEKAPLRQKKLVNAGAFHPSNARQRRPPPPAVAPSKPCPRAWKEDSQPPTIANEKTLCVSTWIPCSGNITPQRAGVRTPAITTCSGQASGHACAAAPRNHAPAISEDFLQTPRAASHLLRETMLRACAGAPPAT